MDLFEILFILLFILFPILEGVRKKGKSGPPGTGKPGTRGADADAGESGVGRPEAGRSEAGPSGAGEGQPTPAADMVPDDLWSILTGETRPRGGVDVEVGDEEEPDTPWSEAADRRSWEPADTVEPAAADLEPDIEPVSLEYEGPEAYSLERTDHRASSLERTDFEPIERRVPDPETRHRAFHAFIDRPRPTRRRRKSAVGRALQDPESLRNAFVLAEVLGRPKGLE